ncbi:hypothetical protein FHG66_05980 [Rubellimicrobium rubrum]|uniref:Uncharacterized protein n=1 Tax=Rubellimicrobium rubrum TaxID=2585369 RepID=A0A5C4N1D7_9RHOB|nr:DNA-primase RepB domain-containing protein [Rubellimicrobium rubrum]TNC51100.1 hypothetical protein FHG66_05980 [Rubellimicrobium rubrum]
MQHPSPFDFIAAEPAATHLSTADFVRLIHPPGSRGKPTLMAIFDAETTWSRALPPDVLPLAAETALDEPTYLSMNRFWGPRRSDRLAALGSLYLDLDYWRLPEWAGLAAEEMTAILESELGRCGIPLPSLVVSTGRGLAAIWLLVELPRAAVPRWRGGLRALIELARPLGADPACSDVSRVFRLPGTINPKNGRDVKVIGGTLARYAFDPLADAIYRAAGRPTRKQLKRRRERKAAKVAGEVLPPRGLESTARFRQVARDLERLRWHWCGKIPEGLRNVWLHLFGTCLTHTMEKEEIAKAVEAKAVEATPGLPPSEVRAVIQSLLRRAEGARSSVPAFDGRLHYAGATMALMLGVSDDLAHELRLEQIYSQVERQRRRAGREKARRRADGAVSREEYLREHTLSAERPWEAEGISRATWYRRVAKGRKATLPITSEGSQTAAPP